MASYLFSYLLTEICFCPCRSFALLFLLLLLFALLLFVLLFFAFAGLLLYCSLLLLLFTLLLFVFLFFCLCRSFALLFFAFVAFCPCRSFVLAVLLSLLLFCLYFPFVFATLLPDTWPRAFYYEIFLFKMRVSYFPVAISMNLTNRETLLS